MKLLLLLALWAWPGPAPAPVRLKLPTQPLVRSQVMLLGESHRQLGSVRALAASLPDLRAAGVAVVGIEGLKAPAQAAVDDYVLGGAAALPEESLNFSPQRRDAFRELFEKARREGVRLLAMGLPLDHWGKQVAELTGTEPASLADQVHRAGETYEPGYNEAVAEVALRRRNQYMAERLKKEMSPSAKAVVLVGHAHVSRPPPMDYSHLNVDVSRYGHLGQELLERGLSAYSLTLLGGAFITPKDAIDHYWLLKGAYQLPDGDLAADAGIHRLNSPAPLGTASEVRTR